MYEAEYYGPAGLERMKDWVEENDGRNPGEIDWENGDYFMACTLRQLRELDSETMNEVRVVKSYIGPPSTPAPEQEVEPEETDEDAKEVTDDTSTESDSLILSDDDTDTPEIDPEFEAGTTPLKPDTNYQAPTVVTEDSNSEHSSDSSSMMTFPEYVEEDAMRMFNGSYADSEEGHAERYGTDRTEEDQITVVGSAEPDMDDFRLNPNRSDIDLTPQQILNYKDYEPIDFDKGYNQVDPQKIRQDLARTFGTRNYGFQVVGTNLPYTHDTIENMSDYYQMPLIELAEPVEPFTIPEEDESYEARANIGNLTEAHYKEFYGIDPQYKGKAVATESSPEFLPKQTQPASYSLILYLTGKGLSLKAIADIILTLDYKFLDNWDPRWFNGHRIPEHWEMTDKMIEKIKDICKAPEYWWEEMDGKNDEIVTMTMRKFWFTYYENRSIRFVRWVLEDYVRLRAGLPASADSKPQRFVEMVMRK